MLGYVQVYTGDGKGKTTAALGLALRAAGRGLKVLITQFAKGSDTGELRALKDIPNITLHRCGTERFITENPAREIIEKTREGFAEVRREILTGQYDMVILDEINIAVHFKMISAEEVLTLIDDKPAHTELILTGRKAAPEIIARADLVTEMRNVKHYYDRAVGARKGIEY